MPEPLQKLYQPSQNPYHNVNYLGRYIKRPPIAFSRLRHYDGNEVVFNFLNHKTANHKNSHCSTEEFIERFIQHIPEKYFRLIRYYGFLANRNRKTSLPIVYTAINQQPKRSFPLRFNQLMKKELGFDPLLCILCNSKLYFVSISVGLNHQEIKKHHKSLAQLNLGVVRPKFVKTDKTTGFSFKFFFLNHRLDQLFQKMLFYNHLNS